MQYLNNIKVYRRLKRQLTDSQVSQDPIRLYSYSRDAGFYRLLPQIVVKARTIHDIGELFETANAEKRKIVFRAAGTSLSGQSISDDILVEVKQGWRSVEVLQRGAAIRLGPGVVAAKANQHLEPLGYRIGPDPGSIRAALIGGIVANNASGIGSGIKYNSYQTLAAMKLVLPNGLILDTANPNDHEKLHAKATEVYDGLYRLRDQIRSDDLLSKHIRNKYKLKNTMGYSLNSFLDFDQPLDILAHLMVGSEGTLGFIAEVTLNTVALRKHKSTALLLLPSLKDAARLVPKLKKIGTAALEIMDDSALRAISHISGLPPEIHAYIPDGSAALLIEYQADEWKNLDQKVEAALDLIQQSHPNLAPKFFKDPIQRERLWKVRRELGPLHAATRPSGSTVLSEDVCFKVKDLARAIKDLKFLLKHFGYKDAVIFGHAGDGNLHFKLSLDLSNPSALERYAQFMEALVELVVDKYAGSLKAEHGTGRNMAPFVEREWGKDAYKIMEEIKSLLDPGKILNPDVLICSDNQIHLKNIKPIPLVDPIVDKCIECGLCEPSCPSADLTFTPRQRIGVLREIEGLNENFKNQGIVKALEKAFLYQGVETCATDGLCGLNCPVDIDTGLLMKQMRSQKHGKIKMMFHRIAQRNFASVMLGLRVLLRSLTPLRLALSNPYFSKGWRHLTQFSGGKIPLLNVYMKAARAALPEADRVVDVLYYPSCISRSLADPGQTGLSVPKAFTDILRQASIRFSYPNNLSNLCCGLSYSSKGYSEAALQAAIQTTDSLWISSDEGRLPIIMDTSPCSGQLKHYDQLLNGVHLARWRSLKILDMVEYLHDEVIEKLSLWHVQNTVVLHPTCSTKHMGLEAKMKAIAQRCATEVIIPIDTGCCGFAGDKGMLIPELTASASMEEASEVRRIAADGYYSSSRTCEIGMSQATDQNYHSLIYLVHKAMIPSGTNTNPIKSRTETRRLSD